MAPLVRRKDHGVPHIRVTVDDRTGRHDYYEQLSDFAILVERLMMAAVLVLFGGTIAEGYSDR